MFYGHISVDMLLSTIFDIYLYKQVIRTLVVFQRAIKVNLRPYHRD
jgi:hypothetical protein